MHIKKILKLWLNKRIYTLLSYEKLTKEQEKLLDFYVENYFKLYG